jgi:predicted DsbA family dithiol-disulfide isomerase
MTVVPITYFSDVLCVWAYVAQARVDAVRAGFGNDVRLQHRFCSVFGDARTKIANSWRDRGGFEGYGEHVRGVASRFGHVRIHPNIWVSSQPASSASPHLFLSAIRELELARKPTAAAAAAPSVFESVMWAFRRGFFEEGLDIADWQVQCDLARPFDIDISEVEQAIRSGVAFARLAADYQDADKMRIEGSPTFVLNEGRQKLFGNVGYRVIESNVRELLREPNQDQASWC